MKLDWKPILAICLFLMTFRAASQNNWPPFAEEMQMTKTDVLDAKIRSVSLSISRSVMDTIESQWIRFNKDGTISEYRDYHDQRKYT